METAVASAQQRQDHRHQGSISMRGHAGAAIDYPASAEGYDDIPSRLALESTPQFYAHQMLGVISNEILNATTDWFNVSSSTESPFGADGDDMDEHGYVPYTERPETYIVPVLFAIIFIIGVLGNGVLILIFLRHRTMRNVPNM